MGTVHRSSVRPWSNYEGEEDKPRKVVVKYFNGSQLHTGIKENDAQRASLIEFALERWMAK
jgi:hypothetical protein